MGRRSSEFGKLARDGVPASGISWPSFDFNNLTEKQREQIKKERGEERLADFRARAAVVAGRVEIEE
jgi:hypothetical protein